MIVYNRIKVPEIASLTKHTPLFKVRCMYFNCWEFGDTIYISTVRPRDTTHGPVVLYMSPHQATY
jgi:hypothetical protein